MPFISHEGGFVVIGLQGQSTIMAECRPDNNARYGCGRRKRMEFRDFLDRLAAGDDTLYLSAQKVKIGGGHLQGPHISA